MKKKGKFNCLESFLFLTDTTKKKRLREPDQCDVRNEGGISLSIVSFCIQIKFYELSIMIWFVHYFLLILLRNVRRVLRDEEEKTGSVLCFFFSL